MTIEIEGPDGTIYEFPDGTDDATIKAAMQKQFGKPKTFVEETANALRSANDFLLGGGADEYEGAMFTAGDVFRGRIGLEDIPRTFEQYRANADQERRDFERRRPAAAIAAKTAGGLATLPFAARQAANAERIAAETLRVGTPSAAQVAQRTAPATPLVDSAKAGLVTGAASGYLSADPEDRPLGTAVGAATGAIVAPAVTAGVALATRPPQSAQDRAYKMVGRALQEGGALDPVLNKKTKDVAPQIRQRSAQLQRQRGSVEETIAEVGGPGAQGLARAVANVPGPGQKIAQDTLQGRRSEMSQRVIAAAKKSAGKPRDYGEMVVEIATIGRQRQQQNYDKAMKAAEDVVLAANETAGLSNDIDNHLYDVDKGPGVVPTQSDMVGLQRARSVVSNLEKLTGSGRFTLRGVERYRQQLNRIADSAKQDGYDAGSVREVIRQLDAKLDTIAKARAAAGDGRFQAELNNLKATRQEYGTMKQTEEAIAQGRQVLKDDATDTYLWMNNDGRGRSQAEADGYMVGVVKAVEDAINRNDAAAIGRINRDKNLQSALKQALGNKEAKALLGRINREATMNANANAILAGSRTTPMREEIDRWTKGEDDMAFLSDLVMNPAPVRNIFLKVFQATYNRMNRPGIYNPEVNKAVADILYNRATTQRVDDLLAIIQRDPQAAAAARQAMETARLGALRQRIDNAALIDRLPARQVGSAASQAATQSAPRDERRDVWIESSQNIP